MCLTAEGSLKPRCRFCLRSLDGPLHEPRVLQHLQVLGDSGLGERQVRHNLAADALLPLGQEPDDGEPHPVREGFQVAGKLHVPRAKERPVFADMAG